MSRVETAQHSSNFVATKVFEISPLLMIWAWICLTLLTVMLLEGCNSERTWPLENLNFERADVKLARKRRWLGSVRH